MSRPNGHRVFISVYVYCFVLYAVCTALFVAPFVRLHGMRATEVEPSAAWGRRS